MDIIDETHIYYDPYLPFRIFLINHEAINIPAHIHLSLELLYVINGNTKITVDGKSVITKKDDFLIINSYEVHSFDYFEEGAQILAIQFEPSVINPSFNSFYQMKYIIPFLNRKLEYSKYLNIRKDSELRSLLQEMIHEAEYKTPGYELEIKADILKVFVYLIRHNHISVPVADERNSTDFLTLKMLFEFIENNYQEEISTEAAAKKVHMSLPHFCRLFKKVSGRTFIEYLNYVRICEAQKLLLMTNEKMMSISEKCGFTSLSYFNKTFRKEKGLTPHEYRNQNCANFG